MCAGFGAISVFFCLAVAIAEGDLAIVAGDDVLFEQDTAVEIAR